VNESSLLIVKRVEASDKLAYKLKHAAEVLDISYMSLHREIMRRKIFPTRTLKLITRKELLRYLGEEEQLARRKRTRSKKSEPTPCPKTPLFSSCPVSENSVTNEAAESASRLSGSLTDSSGANLTPPAAPTTEAKRL
jgi:hypothetical protein